MPEPHAPPCPLPPCPRPPRAPVLPYLHRLPDILHRVVEVQNTRGESSEELAEHPPETAAAVAQPHHPRGLLNVLAQRFESKARLERLDITEHGHYPALLEQTGLDREGVLATLAHPMVEPGDEAYLDLAPHDRSTWVPARLVAAAPSRHRRPP